MFEEYGVVEHCKLLSQLDGMGRRRYVLLRRQLMSGVSS